MERKEKRMAARFKCGRAEVTSTGTSSMVVADFMGIFSPMSGTRRGTAFSGSDCCNALSLLYSLRNCRLFSVTSQVYLKHYNENVAQHLRRGGVRRSSPVGRPRQQRGMEWVWEAHRPPCEPTVAREVPQALGPLSLSLERRSAPQAGEVAPPAAPRRGKASRRRLLKCKRAFHSEPGIERTSLAEAGTEPKWVSCGDGSSA